jgi:hypothetical protein
MNTNNITNRNLLDMHFISAMVLVGLVVIVPSLISLEQQSFGQQQQQGTNNTATSTATTTAASNQSAAASSSASVTAAEGPG